MNYQETIEYLFNSTPVFEKIGAKAYKPGLQTTFALDEHFGHPHQKYKTIHIAGTNGKGSSSHSPKPGLQGRTLHLSPSGRFQRTYPSERRMRSGAVCH